MDIDMTKPIRGAPTRGSTGVSDRPRQPNTALREAGDTQSVAVPLLTWLMVVLKRLWVERPPEAPIASAMKLGRLTRPFVHRRVDSMLPAYVLSLPWIRSLAGPFATSVRPHRVSS